MATEAACSNCHAALPERASYCCRCGQTTQYAPRRLRTIVQGVFGRDFAPDGRLWLTLRTLLVPGALTRDWIEGRQQRHIGPMRLFLLVLFVLTLVAQLLLASTSQAARLDEVTELEPAFHYEVGPAWGDPQPLLVQRYPEATVILRGGWLREPLLPMAIEAKSTLERLSARGFLDHAAPRINSMQSHAQIALLPVVIAMLSLAYLGQGQPVAKHTVFALHAAALWLLLELAATLCAQAIEPAHGSLVLGVVRGLPVAIGSVWLLVAMHRVYPATRHGSIGRGLLVVSALFLVLPHVEIVAVLLALR